MATLRVITACNPAILLKHAADGFLVPRPASDADPFPTVPYLLAVRQGGLRDDVIELAAMRGLPGWFEPPLCIFGELPKWLGASQSEVLGEVERLVLLERLLQDDPHSVFAGLSQPAGFIDAADRLFGELAAERVSPAQFEGAANGRDADDEFDRRRTASLTRAYKAYQTELSRLGKLDGRDTWARCADAVREAPGDVAAALGTRREIRIVGLQDLRRGWRALLSALVESPAIDTVAIYTSVDLELEGLRFEHERLGEPESGARQLFAMQPSKAPGAASLIAAPDSEREMDEVARRVRALIDNGTPPHRIAVISRSARPHADLVIASLRRFGVPSSARQRVRLREIPAVRAVLSLFSAAAEGWTRNGLVELADQPYLDCSLDSVVIGFVGYGYPVKGLAEWEEQLATLERRVSQSEASTDEDLTRRRALPSATRVIQARESFSRFAMKAKSLDDARSLGEWLDWLDTFLTSDPWGIRARINHVPAGRFDLARLDIAGWNRMRAIVSEWRKAVDTHEAPNERLTVATFAARVAHAFDGDVALWTSSHRGVQVLEALAAAYRSFDHVFLVGMASGAFPKAAVSSPILDRTAREALTGAGIPLESPEVWDERERELFRVLVAGAAESLTLSYSRLDGNGREVIRSVFAEELADVMELQDLELPSSQVVVEGVSLFRRVGDGATAFRVASIERHREAGLLSVHNGHITSLDLVESLQQEFGNDRLWSPTQLEDMAKCAWSYMSKRLLRIEAPSEPTDDMQHTTSGIVLHRTLQRFYSLAKERVGGPVFLLPEDATWAEPMCVAALEHTLDSMNADHWLGHPVLRSARRAEFQRTAVKFLKWEMELHGDMLNPRTRKKRPPVMIRTAVDEHELEFSGVEYTQDEVTIRFRGSIDRVEVSVDPRAPNVAFIAAADYKSTKSSTPGAGDKAAWKDGVVLQVPLYAYALSKLRPGNEVARVEYLALKKPEAVHSLDLYTIDKSGPQPDVDTQTQWQEALTAAVNTIRQARRGEFAAQPKPSCACPPWCHGWDICRVKGGPA